MYDTITCENCDSNDNVTSSFDGAVILDLCEDCRDEATDDHGQPRDF